PCRRRSCSSIAPRSIGSPAGRPSRMVISAGPCDSPAVRKRNMTLLGPHAGGVGRRRVLYPVYARDLCRVPLHTSGILRNAILRQRAGLRVLDTVSRVVLLVALLGLAFGLAFGLATPTTADAGCVQRQEVQLGS